MNLDDYRLLTKKLIPKFKYIVDILIDIAIDSFNSKNKDKFGTVVLTLLDIRDILTDKINDFELGSLMYWAYFRDPTTWSTFLIKRKIYMDDKSIISSWIFVSGIYWKLYNNFIECLRNRSSWDILKTNYDLIIKCLNRKYPKGFINERDDIN